MKMSVDKVLALVVTAANPAIGALYMSDNPGKAAGIALLLSFPGLVVIWHRQSLGQTTFARGIARRSPPGLVGAIGWLYLLVFPLLFVFQASRTP